MRENLGRETARAATTARRACEEVRRLGGLPVPRARVAGLPRSPVWAAETGVRRYVRLRLF